MSNEKNNQHLMMGAAVLAGIVGTLSAMMRSHNRTIEGWTEHAKDAASHVLGKGEALNKNMLLGSVAGGVIGAAAALLLAPKAGSELLKDLTHPFANPRKHSRSASRKQASSKSSSRKSTSASSKSRNTQRKPTTAAESHRGTAKKKVPRRRTATAVLKGAAKATEKAIDSVTGT